MLKIGITIGDPNGIGPEIAIKAALSKTIKQLCEVTLIGETKVLERTAKHLKMKAEFENFPAFLPDTISVFECPRKAPTIISWGKVSANAGGASLAYVQKGIDLALNGQIDALVPCPVSKESVILSGDKIFTGHTEYLVKKTKGGDYSLALWHGNFRVAHVSCHVSLKEAIRLCKKKRIVTVGKLLSSAIKADGIKKPRIGVIGLNPHAGEAGAFGNEEIKEIIPAIKQMRRTGIDAYGPVPPDIIFARMKAGVYDGVVAMYHDQGHIATKTLFFSLGGKGKSTVGGVNVTLGLPIIRTSVDHGTSFDIAGQGVADPSSLIDAITLAVKLAKQK
jgi:4-hydroxythreonine-4-phosphate dehydrogenase